jgi:hypothetical protein
MLFSGRGGAPERAGGENVERVGRGVGVPGEVKPPCEEVPEEGTLSHTSKLTCVR